MKLDANNSPKDSLYIPTSLSEINDLIGSMILKAPTFIDRLGHFPHQNIETRFYQLTEGFGLVRNNLGEERYASLIELAGRAKSMFAADQNDTNGKTDEGRTLLFEIEDILRQSRRSRVKAKSLKIDGNISGE